MRQLVSRVFLLSYVLIVAASTAWAQVPAVQQVPPKGKRVIEPFDYKGVSLEQGSTFKKQVDETRAYYLGIPNDNLLKGFRKRAGLSAPGKDMPGWYGGDIFHIFGQVISGLSRLSAGTGDAACREKVNTLLAEWGKCIAPDGYFFYSTKPNAPHYIYDKTVCGLLDAYLYCGNQDALGHLSRITDWAIKNLERGHGFGNNGTEWYTLSENLYRAYLVTGDTKYRDFAKVWEYTEYWNLYLDKKPISETLHAYSHVNTLSGAGAAYRVTGDTRYLGILTNAYDYIQSNLTYVTGGFGPGELLQGRAKLVDSLLATHNSFETQCGSWAGFMMTKYLLAFTGDARYGDWTELLAINGLGASIPSGPDGQVMYYSDYHLQGATKFYAPGWPCCAGTRPQAVADYYDLIYFKDAGGLYVNLFAASSVKWVQAGQSVTMSQTTKFPESDEVELTVHVAKPTEFTLAVRSPGWLAAPMTATLGGKEISVQVDQKHWARFRRTWSEGDCLRIKLPMEMQASRLTVAAYPAALQYGPVAMAFWAAPGLKKLDLANPAGSLTRLAGQPLAWSLAADPAIELRPLYSYAQGEEYFLYVSPATGNRVPRRLVKYTGPWNYGPQLRYTNVVGSTVEVPFEGTGIRWLGQKFDDAGRAEVMIDGKMVAVVDQYDPKRDLPFEWSWKDLPAGKHTIRLRLLAEKTEKSRSQYINVSAFEAIP